MNGSTVTAQIASDLLYWGYLAPGPGDAGRQALEYRFERVLPVPVESLHVTRAASADGGVVLVGIEPQRLRTHLSQRVDVTPDTWELLPTTMPAHLAQRGVDDAALKGLNLLHGAFEPQPRRTLRLAVVVALHGIGVVVLILLMVGAQRRVTAFTEQVQVIRSQTAALIGEAVPAQPGNPLPPELRLVAELRRLDQAAGSTQRSVLEAGAVLEGIWRQWPQDLRAQVETLTVAEGRVTIRGRVPLLADAERLAQALAEIVVGGRRLRADPLQAQQGDQGAAFVLTLAEPPMAATPSPVVTP